jgi:hypothetical protein
MAIYDNHTVPQPTISTLATSVVLIAILQIEKCRAWRHLQVLES